MLSAGTRVGPYEVVSGLGAGGMGEVYRARDTKLHRETRILASLNHPGFTHGTPRLPSVP